MELLTKLDTESKPEFTHDCDTCKYIGRISNSELVEEAGSSSFDVYRCSIEAGNGASYIARYGNKGHEYWSMPYDILSRVDVSGESGKTTLLLRSMRMVADQYESESGAP